MNSYFPIIFIAIFFAASLAFSFYQYQHQELRTSKLQEAAAQLGLTFNTVPNSIPAAIRGLLQDTNNQLSRNQLHGRYNGYELYVFDYGYKINNNKSSPSLTQTIIAINLVTSGIDLPKFILRPRRIGDNMRRDRFGYDFVDLPTQRNHVLISFEDARDVQEMLAHLPTEFWQWLPFHSNWISDGEWFLCYQKNQTIPAESGAFEKAIGQALHDCQQLSLGRGKSQKIES